MGSIKGRESQDLYFRNLDGEGTLLSWPTSPTKTITNHVRLLSSSALEDVIIQNYSFELSWGGQTFYQGTSSFGYFPLPMLENQSGLDVGQTNRTWQEENKLSCRTSDKDQSRANVLALSPDAHYLAWGENDGDCVVYSLAPLEEYYRYQALRNSRPLYALTFTPDSRYLISEGDQNGIQIRGFKEQERDINVTISGHNDSIYDLAFNAQGSSLLTGSGDQSVNMYDFEAYVKHLGLELVRPYQQADVDRLIDDVEQFTGLTIDGIHAVNVDFYGKDGFQKASYELVHL